MVKKVKRAVRIKEPERRQVELRTQSVDELVGSDHPARLIDRVLGTMNLEAFVREAKSVRFGSGRPVTSPRMLLTLWLYAISEGIGSAREIERLTTTHDAYRWIVGDLRPSHDVIATFRVEHGEAFSALLSDVLGALMSKKLVDLHVVAQDGTRVRASAASTSFKGSKALADCRQQARLHLKAVLSASLDEESEAVRRARVAKARDIEARVNAAIEELGELRPSRAQEPRASTTDKDARTMKMADGGFRPAYNVQLCVAGAAMGGARTIVGVRVTNVGSDQGALVPMVDQVGQRTGEAPEIVLADANHDKLDDVAELRRRGITAILPLRKRRSLDSLKDKKWRRQRAAQEAQRDAEITPTMRLEYRRRPGLVELANATFKGRFGVDRLYVRGLGKVTCVALLAALTFNITQHLTHLAS